MNAEPTIHTFYNQDQASLFLSRMRADGHRAYLLDQGTGWLWGPIAVGGIRVAVYELTEEEQAIDVPPAPKPARNIFPEWVSMVVVAFVATAFAAGVIFVLRQAEPGSGLSPILVMIDFILSFIIAPVAVALLFIPVIFNGVNALRTPSSLLGRFWWWIIWLIVFASIVFVYN